jgi:hypothetical protein
MGLLPCCILALAGDPVPNVSTELWAAPDQRLILYRSGDTDGLRICPRVNDMDIQPFCRSFAAPVLGACGFTDELQLVLANGEIHRVNRALIGVNGDFGPAYRPRRALDLVKAWMPDKICHPGAGFNHILAVAASGELWHFDGMGWRVISGHHVGLLGPE